MYWHISLLKRVYWHSELLTEVYWHSKVLTGVYWHILLLTGMYWHSKLLTGVYWHSKVLTGLYWHSKQLTEVQWYTRVISVVHWHSKALKEVYWQKCTRLDTLPISKYLQCLYTYITVRFTIKSKLFYVILIANKIIYSVGKISNIMSLFVLHTSIYLLDSSPPISTTTNSVEASRNLSFFKKMTKSPLSLFWSKCIWKFV